MLTFFSTPKPFVGHLDTIQRNAIRSWQQIHPDAEVLLIGDDAGAAEVCQEFGIQHIKHVAKNRYGTKYLASIYDQAQEVARHPRLCHINCDIVLLSDFRAAVEALSKVFDRFLMAGRRWDTDVREPLDFKAPDWEKTLRNRVFDAGHQKPPEWIDYFVFDKGLYYQKIPGFVIGRPGWDPWLLWYALHAGVPVVDASAEVCVVHQNHDYSYHADGEKGVWEGEEAQENYRLLDGHRKIRTLGDATLRLEKSGIHHNYARWVVRAKRELREWFSPIWFHLLDVTRPVRHKIGLRQKARM